MKKLLFPLFLLLFAVAVQAQIQDDQVRVSGKKIDDLQSVIAFLKEKDYGLDLQYINFRS